VGCTEIDVMAYENIFIIRRISEVFVQNSAHTAMATDVSRYTLALNIVDI